MRSPTRRQESYRFGEWVVEPALCRAVNGRIVRHLEPRVLEVLCYLLDRPGEVVSQKELLERVWAGRVVEPGAVARNIGVIRRALNDSPRRPTYIETIPKRGYRTLARVTLLPTGQSDTGSASTSDPPRSHRRVGILMTPIDALGREAERVASWLTEEIAYELARESHIRLVRRDESPRWSGDPSASVDYLLKGSVSGGASLPRCIVRLVRAYDGETVWSDAFFGPEDSVASFLQGSIGNLVAMTGTMMTIPPTGAQERIATPSTDNPTAFAHYLRAVASWGNFAPTGPVHDAVDAAISLDPEFAKGLAFKSFIHAIEAVAGPAFVGTDFGVEEQRRFASLAQDYAARALEIDSAQARAHWSLGWVHVLSREWDASERSFEHAFELDPNDYVVLNGVAWVSLSRGDIPMGLQYMARSVALNPSDFANQGNFLTYLIMCERWDVAKLQAGVMTTLAPDDASGYVALADVASYLGDAEGVRRNGTMAQARSDFPIVTLANAYRRVGDEASARRIVDDLKASDESHDVLMRASMHMAIDEVETALDYLEDAIDEGFPWLAARDLHYLSHHPMFDSIRQRPRFQSLVRKAGEPVHQQ